MGQDAAFVVLSGSMSGTFEAGDVVFVEKVAPTALQVGDVITFRPEGSAAFVSHRIVAIDETGAGPMFTTKGDANEGPDGQPVRGGDVAGRYTFRVAGYGHVMAWMTSSVWGLVMTLVVGGYVLARETWVVVQILGTIPAKKAAGSQAAVALREPGGMAEVPT